MRRCLLILALACLPLFAADPIEYKLEANLSYLPADAPDLTDYQRERCKLDIYHPANHPGFATVVWYHGGGLTNGGKHIANELRNKGIAVVAVNYRLSPQVKARECIEDAAAALAWTFRHIAEYGGNPDRIFVSGHSAGGYLTSMLGYDKRWLTAHDLDANRIAGLAPLSGQTITHMTVRRENGIPNKQPVVDEFAPLYHVRADAPPTLLITGDREMEMLGRYEENAYFMRMLKVAGHKQVTLFEIQGYGHGMTGPAYPILLRWMQQISPDPKPDPAPQI
ncbi:MAG: alpha/beta hydrolase [Lentisphaeria bacterium]|jgi:acetyl esterase/lipase|nr:alpha/beta hydrolase [Lentisphaeria bacterium]